MLDKIESDIRDRLAKQPISSRVLLDRLRILDESSRRTSQYQDPNYLPFYYYLSKFISPKSVLNVGFDLGLPICCFLTGNSTTERALAFQPADKSFYSPRIAISNVTDVRPGIILDYYYGKILDGELESKMSKGFDCVIVSSKMNPDDLNDIMEISWRHMNLDAFLVVDHVSSNPKEGDIFRSFCKAKSRPAVVFPTRYGVGFTQK